ncbi:MAG TPA: hydroxymethylglutaryl-CoA reductase (NADPH) [Candidatus Korarchaeota archaeon]|nr:hydroxymethylglutaryl-CoA reductase (NADPH) [Candidatus Korarchaeota archaeon]
MENLLGDLLRDRVKLRELDALLGDSNKAADLRLKFLENVTGADLKPIARSRLDFSRLVRWNIENPVGEVSVPLGVVGPLRVEGDYARGTFYPLLATTEGALVASVNRGATTITMAGGARTKILRDGMARAPALVAPTAARAAEVAEWVSNNLERLQRVVEEVTSHGRLLCVQPFQAGRTLFLRFLFETGDAMGMNMVTIASDRILSVLKERFPDLDPIALSGNVCSDKKPASVNWVAGRGKTVVAEAFIPEDLVKSRLKTSVDRLAEVAWRKNLLGAAVAGSMGGFNANVANVVAAMFIAYGQDLAQVVESSMGITTVEPQDSGVYISLTLPSLEVGTVGGGTRLPYARAALSALGCAGGGDPPGVNARKFAEILAATALSGELSLLASLAEGSLARSHQRLGRGGGF